MTRPKRRQSGDYCCGGRSANSPRKRWHGWPGGASLTTQSRAPGGARPMAKAAGLDFSPLTYEDAAAAAAAVTRDQPRRPMPADRLLLMWKNTEQVSTVRRFGVDAGGRRVGWTSVVRLGAPNENHAVVNIILPGADRALYDAAAAYALEQARAIGVRTASAQIWEDNPAGREALRGGGWEEKRKQRYWRLDLAPNRDRIQALAEAAMARAAGAGVNITTADRLGGVAGFPALYEVNAAASRDIPAIVAFEPDPYEVWLSW